MGNFSRGGFTIPYFTDIFAPQQLLQQYAR